VRRVPKADAAPASAPAEGDAEEAPEPTAESEAAPKKRRRRRRKPSGGGAAPAAE